MSNLVNMKQTVLSLYGNGTPVMACELPSCFADELNSKAVSVQQMYMTNTSIPIFVPELISETTASYSPGATTSHVLGNTGGLNRLDYFFVFRKYDDNSAATACIVNWAPSNPNAMTPPAFIPDENSVFTTPYFHCFDFTQFLMMCNEAVTAAINDVTPLADYIVFSLDESSQTFNLSIPSSLSSSEYQLEMSPKLAKLFPFNSTKTNYGTFAIRWSNLLQEVNGIEYYNACAPIYDTIFPFDSILLSTDLPLFPIEFISNRASAYPLQKSVMFQFRKINAGLNIYDHFIASNDYMLDKAHRFTQNNPANGRRMSITLILRTRKNENYLEWNFPSDSKLELVLNTYSVM